MGAVGTIAIDFGSIPSSQAQVDVTGQTDILSTSLAEAWVMADSTSDNDTNSHQFAGVSFRLTCGMPTAGVGFTIYAVTLAGEATGEFKIKYVWS